MPSSVTSPADVLNVTLRRIGYKGRVGNLYDGSLAAKRALDIYGQTRDELLRQNDWGFAERNLDMTLLKQAPKGGYIPPTLWTPAYPPLPWLYEYARPGDCLKIRSIKAVPLFLPNMDPQPIVFTEAGWPNQEGCAKEPWNYYGSSKPDAQTQALQDQINGYTIE